VCPDGPLVRFLPQPATQVRRRRLLADHRGSRDLVGAEQVLRVLLDEERGSVVRLVLLVPMTGAAWCARTPPRGARAGAAGRAGPATAGTVERAGPATAAATLAVRVRPASALTGRGEPAAPAPGRLLGRRGAAGARSAGARFRVAQVTPARVANGAESAHYLY